MYAYPLIENEEIGEEHLPIEYTVDGQNDDQLIENIEETNSLENDGNCDH